MRTTFQTRTHDSDRFDGRPDSRGHPLRDLDNLARVERYDLDEFICCEARSAENCYRIVSGAACRSASRADGSRHVIDILLPGDYFGFLVADDEGLTIEAADDDTVVAVYPRWGVDFLTEVDPTVCEALAGLERDAISRTRAHLSSNRRTTATARLNAFLLEMNHRVSFDDPDGFELPLSINRIADYLEIAAPTIERYLTFLREFGAIARRGRRKFRILDFRLLGVLDFVHVAPNFNFLSMTFDADREMGDVADSTERTSSLRGLRSLH